MNPKLAYNELDGALASLFLTHSYSIKDFTQLTVFKLEKEIRWSVNIRELSMPNVANLENSL